MLRAFAQAFRTPDLRRKLLFTLGIVALFRLGTRFPVPGVSFAAVQECLRQSDTDNAFGLVNLFSGGALLQLSVFSLGIMPYITASIILQLLATVMPRLAALKDDGQAGAAKITAYTRYLTMALAALQGAGVTSTAISGTLFPSCNTRDRVVPNTSALWISGMVLALIAGTVLIMWFGELITERGIGSGMSILMFASVAAGLPGALWAIWSQGTIASGWGELASVLAMGMTVIVLAVFVEQAQRRIPVRYVKPAGRSLINHSTSTYLPMRLNQAGVVPVIFAASMLYLPVLAVEFSGSSSPWAVWVQSNLVKGDSSLYMSSYFALVVFFAFFYAPTAFDPERVGDDLKRGGGCIPGIRIGRPTVEYLRHVLTRLTWPGSLYLATVALLPLIVLTAFRTGSSFPFGGTSILIIVGVGLETLKRLESQLQQHNYEGFLR
ncbi:preprotein translocase subunit SecY [Kitasatospora sp. NPDC086791]|uniref:preprotein translocase subunit SecY n=1 Tax=Kitasatospora sp. NPDC086791 TaxID=3155178 RepID=UPI0034338447